jgi:outer membrane protein insertion porin family
MCYKEQIMKKLWLILFGMLLPLAAFGQELIERIDIAGNERVTKETIMYYLSSREGDYFSEDLLKKDFRVLWSTGFFTDIKIENSQAPRGRIIKITVEEAPLIKSITYKTGRKVKEDDITNKLKEKDEYLLAYSNYSPFKLQKIKKTIEDLLAEKGLGAAVVEIVTEKKGKNEVDVTFKVDEGPKVRVGEILFVGKAKLPQGVLRDAVKENMPHSLFSWIQGKDVFKQNKLTDDVASIKKTYQENGYMEATLGEPKVEEIQKKTLFPWAKPQKMMRITFPVNAGYLYRVGDIKVEGNKAFTAQGILSQIKFVKGEAYSTKVREKSVESLGELFRNFGYLYAQVMPVENLDPKNKVVNVTYQVFEGEICFLRRMEFRGNLFTKDKVIRREMLLREGDVFSLAFFKDSVLRVKQLGLIDLEKEPDIKPTQADPAQFDVLLNVKELQRNNIQFTAGYSGYEGTFVAASYSTVNFLGGGESFEITAQYGGRIQNYVFGFTEPYLFDLPISAGFNVYKRYQYLPFLYNQKSKGIDLNLGARVIGYWRAGLTYSYQFLDISYPSSTTADATSGSTSTLDPYYMAMFGWGKYNMSSISPSLYRSTIDSPLTPTSGTMYMFSFKYAGTFLGGDVDIFKPMVQFTHFEPIVPQVLSLGAHIEYSEAKPLRSGTQIPFWEHFFLGGERNIRGYEIYTIGPRDDNGTNLGGTKQMIFNAEAILHVGGGESPLYLIAFHDRGNAWSENQKISWTDVYTSTGLEARIFVPALRVPFRLIFSYNNRRIYSTDSNFAFRFAIGTTF